MQELLRTHSSIKKNFPLENISCTRTCNESYHNEPHRPTLKNGSCSLDRNLFYSLYSFVYRSKLYINENGSTGDILAKHH